MEDEQKTDLLLPNPTDATTDDDIGKEKYEINKTRSHSPTSRLGKSVQDVYFTKEYVYYSKKLVDVPLLEQISQKQSLPPLKINKIKEGSPTKDHNICYKYESKIEKNHSITLTNSKAISQNETSSCKTATKTEEVKEDEKFPQDQLEQLISTVIAESKDKILDKPSIYRRQIQISPGGLVPKSEPIAQLSSRAPVKYKNNQSRLVIQKYSPVNEWGSKLYP